MPPHPLILALVGMTLASGVARADMTDCDRAGAVCVPLVVCVEATGEILRGVALGQDAGTILATSDTGAVCEGTWRRSFMGLGLAELICSDGRSATSAFTWFELESGTAVGSGRFSDGEAARFWSGNNLERYFREVAPEERQRMACTPAEMLLG